MPRELAMLLWLALACGGGAACVAPHHIDADFNAMEDAGAPPPEGATAQCRDGHYTFARERGAACSHHGGVQNWLREI